MSVEVDAFYRSLWEAFRDSGLRAVALRYDALVSSVGDYDILIHPDDRQRGCELVAAVAARQGWHRLFYERVSNHYHLGFWRESNTDGQRPIFLNLDLQDALGRKGFLYAPAEAFVRDSMVHDHVPVPRPEARAVALAIHTLLDKGAVRDDHRKAMQRDTVAALESFCESVFPAHVSGGICRWIRAGAPDSQVMSMARELRSYLRRRHPSNLARPLWVRWRRRLAYLGRRRGVLATFLGPDGSGKSTILDAVLSLCPDGPFPVQAVYMGKRDAFLPTSRLIRRIYRKQQDSTDHLEERAPSDGKSSLIFHLKDVAGLANWLLEQWARYLIQIRPVLQQGGVVLTDRYAFDLANRDGRSIAHRKAFRRLLRWLFPLPDRTYLLWEDPEILHARKQELTPEQSARLLERLRAITSDVPNIQEVRTNRPVHVIASGIAREVMSVMESRCRT